MGWYCRWRNFKCVDEFRDENGNAIILMGNHMEEC